MKKTRLIIAEDMEIVREGICRLLNDYPQFEIVGLAADVFRTLELAATSAPDLAIVDLALPTMEEGFGVISELKHRFPALKILALTVHDQASSIHRALSAGVDGYILKTAQLSELAMAITIVTSGKKYLSPDVSTTIIDGYVHGDQEIHSNTFLLSQREREILVYIAKGKGNQEIGKKLFISPKTVEKHKTNLKKKLGCRTSLELASYCVQRGLVDNT